MAGFMDNYEPVANRISAFWADHPQGRIITDIVQLDDKLIIMRAEIYRNVDEQHPAAVDFAQEKIGSTKITTDSWLEVCSTSAIGRALANMNYAKTIDGKIVRPSREEMLKTSAPDRSAEFAGWIQRAEQIAATKDLEMLQSYRAQIIQMNPSAAVMERVDAIGVDLKNRLANENGGVPGN